MGPFWHLGETISLFAIVSWASHCTGIMPTSKAYQFSVRMCFSCALVAKVWIDSPEDAPVLDSTSESPVSFALSPGGFHAAKEKFSRLSTVFPPGLVHQFPTAGSMCLMMRNDEAGVIGLARPNGDARNSLGWMLITYSSPAVRMLTIFVQ